MVRTFGPILMAKVDQASRPLNPLHHYLQALMLM
jgi:hypothetical protein